MTPSGENKDCRKWTALHSVWCICIISWNWALSFVEAFSQETTHKVKVLLQLPTDDPAFSVFATKFGRDFNIRIHFHLSDLHLWTQSLWGGCDTCSWMLTRWNHRHPETGTGGTNADSCRLRNPESITTGWKSTCWPPGRTGPHLKNYTDPQSSRIEFKAQSFCLCLVQCCTKPV